MKQILLDNYKVVGLSGDGIVDSWSLKNINQTRTIVKKEGMIYRIGN